MTIVAVQFKHNCKDYFFKAYEDYAVGDVVVVNTSRGLAIGTISGINIKIQDPNIQNIYLEDVVCKVDMDAFLRRKVLRAEKEKIRREMDLIVAKLPKEDLYDALAEKDPELKGLFDLYRSLF